MSLILPNTFYHEVHWPITTFLYFFGVSIATSSDGPRTDIVLSVTLMILASEREFRLIVTGLPAGHMNNKLNIDRK
jgi:hypothetical protein